MRELRTKQLPLINPAPEHRIAQELNAIAHLIDKQPDEVYERIAADASRSSKAPESNKGAKGMSAEQILRCLIVKIWFGYSYESLAFHILDSTTLRNFSLIGIYGKFFGKSAINRNVKALSPETLAYINGRIVLLAKEMGIEKGNKSRSDATVVESNIHHPTDSSLLWDAVRVLTALLYEVRDILGLPGLSFQDHTRSAKKRAVEIFHAKTEEIKKASYVALLDITRRCASYSRNAVDLISHLPEPDLNLLAMRDNFLEKLELVDKIVNQAERRVLRGEKVPSRDKLVSLFEPHTDIIVKDNRGTQGLPHHRSLESDHQRPCRQGQSGRFGSGLRNGPTPDRFIRTPPGQDDIRRRLRLQEKPRRDQGIGRQGCLLRQKTGTPGKRHVPKPLCLPEAPPLPGGHRSRHILAQAPFEMDRCNWKGFESFQSYVLATVIGANLLTIARAQLNRSVA